MATKRPITVAYGDGIGPEIMTAVMRILEAAGAEIEPEVIEIGQKVYESGVNSGIRPEAWESLRRTKVFLKAPITTPQGGGYKSLNVTARKALGLYSNVRPVQTLQPFVASKHHMDLVIIRENEEDLYAGVEHRQTREVTQCLKLITRPGCERIVRYAFEYARSYNRKKVTCFSKDNIMKMTDGLFHRIFDEIGAEYPEIEKDHRIIDIGSALLADTPERFDVIVTLNLYGDIISDIAAQVAGSVGLCGSANVGDQCAMFEAIHGSAPDIAGQQIANPSGLLNGAIMMLVHINQPEVATRIHNAWLKTLEDRIHTADIFIKGKSEKLATTDEFADAVIERLGQLPTFLKPVSYGEARDHAWAPAPLREMKREEKTLHGMDLFIDFEGSEVALADKLNAMAQGTGLKLSMISNRGLTVWPSIQPEAFKTDHWRCRFFAEVEPQKSVITHKQIISLLANADAAGLDFIKSELLYAFDGVKGYSAGQGE